MHGMGYISAVIIVYLRSLMEICGDLDKGMDSSDGNVLV
jgi:hypothetical protein